MTTGRRQSSPNVVARRAARISTAEFAKSLGGWNLQAAHLRALLTSSHLTVPQRDEAHGAVLALLSEVLRQQAELQVATADLRHDIVDDLVKSYGRLAWQLNQTIDATAGSTLT